MADRRFSGYESGDLRNRRPRDMGYGRPRDPGYGRHRDSSGYNRSRDLGYDRHRDLGYDRHRDVGYDRPRDLGYDRHRDFYFDRPKDLDYDRSRDLNSDKPRRRAKRPLDIMDAPRRKRPPDPRERARSKTGQDLKSRKPRPLIRKDKQGVPNPKTGIRSLKGRSKSVDRGTKDLLRFFKNRVNMPTIRIRDDARFIIYMSQFKDFFSWQLVVSLIIILMGGIGSLTIHAHVTSLESQINIARNDLQQAQVDVFTLEFQLDERYSDTEILWVATDRLGMTFPDPSQIIEINVPRQGGATLNTIMREEPVENYLWNDITYFFRGIIDTVFGGAR